jgi:hypothetical protein
MGALVLLGLVAGIIAYIIDCVMEPEKHVVGLVVLAIVYAIFGSFFESTGAKADYDRKKRG